MGQESNAAGLYDHAGFLAAFTRQFAASPRYNAGAANDMLALLTMIENDPGIVDVRWAAYLLATTMWETTSPRWFERPAPRRRGKAAKGRPLKPEVLKVKRWVMTMAPVDEIGHGRGRRYQQPAKVKVIAGGAVRVTEHDGDQFVVGLDGSISRLRKRARMGAAPAEPAAQAYDDDDGSEQAYFGRGYVQLTWWSNYAQAGVALGRGLDLLLQPELVKSPDVAYALMSHGMRTGTVFANGHKLSDYFSATKTDYEGARAMVNGRDHAADIAALARQFEAVLRESRVDPKPAKGVVP